MANRSEESGKLVFAMAGIEADGKKKDTQSR